MQIACRNRIREIEQKLSEDLGLPMLLLMNQAGEALSRRVMSHLGRIGGKKALIVCGTGNNGGDGLAAAWHLNSMKVAVSVFVTDNPDTLTGLPQFYCKLLNETGVAIGNLQDTAVFSDFKNKLSQCHIIVDALVGIGFMPPMKESMRKIVEMINLSGQYVVSADIPSGVDCDTGQADTAVQAHETVAFLVPTPGHYLFPGASYRGKLLYERLGIPDSFLAPYAHITAAEITEMAALWRPRSMDTHKGKQGKLLIIAGSDEYPGAAVLAARGAARSGVGLIFMAAQGYDCRYPMPPEVISVGEEAICDESPYARIQNMIRKFDDVDAVLIGPGMSCRPDVAQAIVDSVLQIHAPMVLDADALNAFCGHTVQLGEIKQPFIVTPHPGEMARLARQSVESIQRNRILTASRFAGEWNCTVVLKGAGSVTASANGATYINTTGNPGMATGGSGDVLAGLIGGLLAQGYPAEHAAALGVFIHGAAGDRAAVLHGPVGYTPSELADCIPWIQKELEQSKTAGKQWIPAEKSI